MAGNTESRQARRLSVRAATEPLPTPLPPPRPGRLGAPLEGEPGSHHDHSVPPRPHFVTRFPAIDHSQLEMKTASEPEPKQFSQPQLGLPEQPVPERSLASPGVIMSLAASVAVLCAIGWYEKYGVEGVKWDAIKTFVQSWSVDPVDRDEGLPFITAVPLTPNPRGTELIAEDERPTSQNTRQVLLSDLLKDEAAGTPDDDRTQLR